MPEGAGHSLNREVVETLSDAVLRSKVDDPYEKKLIHTVRGVGYVLEERD